MNEPEPMSLVVIHYTPPQLSVCDVFAVLMDLAAEIMEPTSQFSQKSFMYCKPDFEQCLICEHCSNLLPFCSCTSSKRWIAEHGAEFIYCDPLVIYWNESVKPVEHVHIDL